MNRWGILKSLKKTYLAKKGFNSSLTDREITEKEYEHVLCLE